jgi:hypothetical protein
MKCREKALHFSLKHVNSGFNNIKLSNQDLISLVTIYTT